MTNVLLHHPQNLLLQGYRNKYGRSYDVQLIKKRCRDVTTIPLRRKKHAAVTCCLLPALNSSSVSLAAATNMKHTPILSGIMEKMASTCIQCLIIADLDSETAKLLIGIAGPFLSTFSFLFIVRIVMSWYPKLPADKFPYVIAYAPTEPFLLVTRKVLPPLGGVDVTPVVWFGLVSFLNEILVGPQGLLVLLSQKV